MIHKLFAYKKKKNTASQPEKTHDAERLMRLAELGVFTSIDELAVKAKMLKHRQN
ncbi:MAG: hypothetical protein J6U04_09590 [Salinivirgaceae bacterium]|nr:hypothetical protein [Salinivirgaceae bacterium]